MSKNESIEVQGIDWCDDYLTRELPWDKDQYVQVRRLTGREKRRREAMSGTFKMGGGKSEDVEVELAIDRIKAFEWECSIVDFKLKDKKGKVHTFGTPSDNAKIYDHISGSLEKFIDDLVTEINKEDDLGKIEVEQVKGN